MRSYVINFLIILLVNNSLSTESLGQNRLKNEILIKKMAINSKKHPANLLFVHTDKTVYTNNEDLWLSAYLIKSESVDYKLHTILSTALIREDDHKVYLMKRYAMVRGSASGSITLQDTIPPGNYQFLAYTNISGKDKLPVAIFYQSITIKSITRTDFSLQLNLLDSVPVSGKIRIKARIAINNPPSGKVIKPECDPPYISVSISNLASGAYRQPVVVNSKCI